MAYFLRFFTFAVVVLLVFGCNQTQPSTIVTPKNTASLGQIAIKVTGQLHAIPAFEKGLLLLHSFEYEDARTAFLEAQALDSNFVMAIWGEAMTFNHPLWRSQHFEKATDALQKLTKPTIQSALNQATAIEKELVNAVHILYGSGTKVERDVAYMEYLKRLQQKYPDHHEINAWYALSLLGSVENGRNEEVFERGARIAAGILQENPNHPGALHYLIHAYDDPFHAADAIDAANRYAKVAPDAAHALHMPSHIYVSMGMWSEVVQSNIASWEASMKRMERKGLGPQAKSYHALHWLMYGLLQEGKYEAASGLMSDMVKYAGEDLSKQARSYFVAMKGNYLAESGDWSGPLATPTTSIDDLNIRTKATHAFMEGYKAFLEGQTDTLRAIIFSLEKDIRKAGTLQLSKGAPMCSPASNRYVPNQMDIDQASIYQMQLKGLQAQANDNEVAAQNWLKQAVAAELDINYAYGPPEIILPSTELYGNWLIEHGKYEEALRQFEKALQRGPKRLRALTAQLKCLHLLNDPAAETVNQLLQLQLKEADTHVSDELNNITKTKLL